MKDFPELYEKSRLEEMYAQLALQNETIELLHEYFNAFSKFYDIISMKEAFGIIKRHNGDLISEEALIAFSEIARHDGGHYYYILGKDELYEDAPDTEIMDMEIIHESLVDVDLDIYYDVSETQRGKPLYIPEKEELLKYADDMYYEHTPQTETLSDFFRNKMGMDIKKADDLVDECVMCITCSVIPQENPIDAILTDFNRMKVKFTKFQHAEFLHLICDLANNTRLPCNRGFTPNELADRMGIGEAKTISGISAVNSGKTFDSSEIGLVEVVHNSILTGGKAGRNDPCPCGSGKKYKKCCGR